MACYQDDRIAKMFDKLLSDETNDGLFGNVSTPSQRIHFLNGDLARQLRERQAASCVGSQMCTWPGMALQGLNKTDGTVEIWAHADVASAAVSVFVRGGKAGKSC